MSRCNCDSSCSCLIVGSTTECIETTVSGTGSVANPYVIRSEFICETADSLNPTARAFHNTSQSVPHDTVTVLSLNSENFDNDNMHNTAVTNSRLTFNTAGVYHVEGFGAFTAATDYSRILGGIRLNNTTEIGSRNPDGFNPGTVNNEKFFSTSALYKFIVGDYVELIVYHVNGAFAARNVVFFSGISPVLSAVWVSAG